MKQILILLIAALTVVGVEVRADDVTSRHRPLWVVKPAKGKNRFTMESDKELPANNKR